MKPLPKAELWNLPDTHRSELQNNTENTTETNTSLGLGGTSSLFLVDDFTIPVGASW
jgi:hypothetical protein